MNILDVRQGDGTWVTSLDPELLAEPLQLILAIDASAILALFEVRRLRPARIDGARCSRSSSWRAASVTVMERTRLAYGFRNPEHFKTAIYFHCGGLDLYPATHGKAG